MIEYRPTQGQLERLEAARLGASHTSAAVSEARAKLALAIAEDNEAHATLSRAIDAVLYGYNDVAPEQLQRPSHGPNEADGDTDAPSPAPAPGG